MLYLRAEPVGEPNGAYTPTRVRIGGRGGRMGYTHGMRRNIVEASAPTMGRTRVPR